MNIKTILSWYIYILMCNLISSRHNKSQHRIVHGDPTTISNYPSYARLYISLSEHRAMVCGSTYIRPLWFLTAAHCLEWQFGLTPKSPELGRQNRITVLMCLKDIEHARQQRKSQRLIMHHNYVDYINTYNATYFDIGLVKIEAPFTRGPTIELAAIGSKVLVGDETVAIGYGTMENDTEPYELQFVIVAIAQIDKTVLICSNSHGKNFCSGDSGGPMYLSKSKNLIGVITTTYGECTKGVGLYMNVPAFNPWITNITKGGIIMRSGGGHGGSRKSAANCNSKHLELCILMINMVCVVSYRVLLSIKY